MFRKHTNKQSHDEVSKKPNEHIIVIFDFGLADGLHFFVVDVLVLVHEIGGVLDRVEAVRVADCEEWP